jgi:methanogenic corrinoid protein MtbC1
MNAETESQRSARLAARYLELLLDIRRREAFDAVLNEIEAGMPLDAVYIDVLQSAMYEVGRLWQTNAIDVAAEHYVTAATQVLMAQLFPRALIQERMGRSMIGCCLGSELHELGMRMVCDFFEFEGWDTYFMGAITPDNSFLGVVRSRLPDLVCLSATMPFGVSRIRDLIDSLRTMNLPHPPRIMVGGLPFIINPGLAGTVGADATAADARAAVREGFKLVTSHAQNN